MTQAIINLTTLLSWNIEVKDKFEIELVAIKITRLLISNVVLHTQTGAGNKTIYCNNNIKLFHNNLEKALESEDSSKSIYAK